MKARSVWLTHTQQVNSYINSLPRMSALTVGLVLPLCSCAAFILMFSQFAGIVKPGANQGMVGSLFLPLLMINLRW